MRVAVGPNARSTMNGEKYFLIAGAVTLCMLGGGCSIFNNSEPSTSSESIVAKELSDDAVLSHLGKDSWLFQKVMLQEGIDAPTIQDAWVTYQKELGLPGKDHTELSKQREVLSLVPATTRITLIKALATNDDHKNGLVRVTRFVLAQAEDFCKGRHPRIHSIESRNVLHFQEPTASNADQIIQIPIEGRDLHPDCVDLRIIVIGKTFLSSSDQRKYLDLISPTTQNPDMGLIILKNEYLKTLASGDQLEIHAMVSQHDLTPVTSGQKALQKDERVVSYATRTITFYTDQDYKTKVLSTKVPTHDIEAFPLPEEEVEKIYGPLVSDNFYVVDLSIRNRNSSAKLVNTGMILANGRAKVTKKEDERQTKKETKEKKEIHTASTPEYTIPVSAVPRSATLMYTFLDDEAVEQPRAKFFRGLELVGALAAAATAPFGGMVANQAVNLFTGVFIPSANKALPDRWPDFKRNIVNNAMPDLLKIPANSVAGHKHLFFSKNKIDTLISDQGMFDQRYSDRYGNLFGGKWAIPPSYELYYLLYLPLTGAIDFRDFRQKPQNGAPSTKIISLQFDNLDIPFEEVVENAEGQLRLTRENLEQDLADQIGKLERVRKIRGQQLQIDNVSIAYTNLRTYESQLKKQITTLKAASGDANKDLVTYLECYQAIIHALQEDTESANPDLEKDLLSGGDHTLEALQRDKVRLSTLSTRITSVGNLDPSVVAQLKTIELHISKSIQALATYRMAAELIAQTGRDLDLLTSKKPEDQAKVKAVIQLITTGLDDLSKKRAQLAGAKDNKQFILESVNWRSLEPLGKKDREPLKLSVVVAGSETGKVTSEPEGITCSSGTTTTCEKEYARGTVVKLTASGGTLKTWDGACTGKEICEVSLNENKKVTAIFE